MRNCRSSWRRSGRRIGRARSTGSGIWGISNKKDLLYGAEDLNGVTIRLLRSLSATDAWHFDKGFVGTPRGAEAFLWDAEDGLAAQFHTTVRKK